MCGDATMAIKPFVIDTEIADFAPVLVWMAVEKQVYLVSFKDSLRCVSCTCKPLLDECLRQFATLQCMQAMVETTAQQVLHSAVEPARGACAVLLVWLFTSVSKEF